MCSVNIKLLWEDRGEREWSEMEVRCAVFRGFFVEVAYEQGPGGFTVCRVLWNRDGNMFQWLSPEKLAHLYVCAANFYTLPASTGGWAIAAALIGCQLYVHRLAAMCSFALYSPRGAEVALHFNTRAAVVWRACFACVWVVVCTLSSHVMYIQLINVNKILFQTVLLDLCLLFRHLGDCNSKSIQLWQKVNS